MGLRTLPARLETVSIQRVPTIDTKPGIALMKRGRAWMAKRHRVAMAYGYMCAKCGRVWVGRQDHIDQIPREEVAATTSRTCSPCLMSPATMRKRQRK